LGGFSPWGKNYGGEATKRGRLLSSSGTVAKKKWGNLREGGAFQVPLVRPGKGGGGGNGGKG